MSVREIQLIHRRCSIVADRLLLEEIQSENHVADFPAGGQQTDRYRFGIDLIPVALIRFIGIAEKLVLNDRDHHFLQTDSAMHKV